jgi:hypothetical protein
VPFVAYVHANEPEPAPSGRPAWEPNWRLWRWVLAAIPLSIAADHSQGAVAFVLVVAVFTLVCKAVAELWPDGDGMREYRQ